MKFKQTIFFVFIIIVVAFGFKDQCFNKKKLEQTRIMIERDFSENSYQWKITSKCKLAIVTVNGVPLRKYMEKNFPKFKGSDEELTMLALKSK